MIVGIDIGNATIKTNKGILYDAKLTTIEPMNKCDTIKIDNKTYYLGEGEYDTTYRKIKKEGYLTFLYSALALSSSASRNKVVLGLPLSQFKEDKSELINLILTNNHKKVVINGKERNLEIEDIEVFPEGVVTLADDYEGIVVDIGGGTTDIALVENYRGRRKIINPISFPLGTIKLYGGFIKALNSKFCLDLSIEDADRILRNGLFLEGEKVDIKFALDTFDNFVEKLVSNIQIEYSLKTNLISLTGGGGALLSDKLSKRLGKGVSLQEESIYSNARNYYELGCSLWE